MWVIGYDGTRLKKILDELGMEICRIDKIIMDVERNKRIGCIDNRLRSWIYLKWSLQDLLWKLECKVLDEFEI